MSYPNREVVTNRDDFARLIFNLLDDNDAIEWKNETVYQFLQTMVAWLHDADKFYVELGEKPNASRASWQLFADMICAAAVPK